MGTGDQVDRLVWSSPVRGGHYTPEQVYIRQEEEYSSLFNSLLFGTLLLIRGGLAEVL